MRSRERTALVWFRRDLRVADHPALSAAIAGCDRVIPLFVWDPHLMRTAGANRLAFFAACVRSLRDSLGGKLVIRAGEPVDVLAATATEAGADALFVTGDYGPYGLERDGRVAAALPGGIPLYAVDSPYAVSPGTLRTSPGSSFQVFSAFARAWRRHGWSQPCAPPPLQKVTRAGLKDWDLPMEVPVPGASAPPGGEDAAHQRLEQFLETGVRAYRDERDRADLDSTSHLSSYLKTGCLHPRQILSRLEPGDPGSEKFRDELGWREFFADVLFHRPDSARHAYRPGWEHLQVDEGEAADQMFQAWAQGRTGFPIVDAGMRQLLSEGWMPNRVRMVAASFLVKDLHLDWRRGARWFMQHLVDADLASNQLNWQWVAGCGTDAAPFFRIFNPVAQSRKFDPEGHYIRQWVPELGRMDPRAIHDPWSIGDGSPYPRPVVEHHEERTVALDRFDRLRARSGLTG